MSNISLTRKLSSFSHEKKVSKFESLKIHSQIVEETYTSRHRTKNGWMKVKFDTFLPLYIDIYQRIIIFRVWKTSKKKRRK